MGVVQGVPLRPIGYKLGLEILVKGRHAKVVEIPIYFQDRDRGASKMTLKVKAAFLIHVARLYGETLMAKTGHGPHR